MVDRAFYVGLVHYPVMNKLNQVVTTSITNMDIHDIARTCLTFGAKGYFVINPMESQNALYKKVVDFWHSETGVQYQKDRADALKNVSYHFSLEEAIEHIKNQEKSNPVVVTTTAQERDDQIAYEQFDTIVPLQRPVLLLFGTGYGLAEEVHQNADYVLKPISGRSDYNHLSVRCAVAVILDRLFPRNIGGNDGFIASCEQITN